MDASRRPRRNLTIGIVFALAEEERSLANVLAESRAGFRDGPDGSTWHIGGLQIMVRVAGVGAKRSSQTARELLRSGAQLVISAGFAAGLDPTAEVGDVVVASRILSIGDETLQCDSRLVLAVPPSGKFGFVIRHGDLLTTDFVASTAADKARVYRQTGAAALDMESYAVGQECARSGVPFAAIRAISDTANEDLPAAVDDLATAASPLHRLAIIASRPGQWVPLARVRRQARLAAANLAEVLSLVLVRLV